jgi:hypothetical protein
MSAVSLKMLVGTSENSSIGVGALTMVEFEKLNELERLDEAEEEGESEGEKTGASLSDVASLTASGSRTW